MKIITADVEDSKRKKWQMSSEDVMSLLQLNPEMSGGKELFLREQRNWFLKVEYVYAKDAVNIVEITINYWEYFLSDNTVARFEKLQIWKEDLL